MNQCKYCSKPYSVQVINLFQNFCSSTKGFKIHDRIRIDSTIVNLLNVKNTWQMQRKPITIFDFNISIWFYHLGIELIGEFNKFTIGEFENFIQWTTKIQARNIPVTMIEISWNNFRVVLIWKLLTNGMLFEMFLVIYFAGETIIPFLKSTN